MLKKAGTVAVGAAAGLFVMSPAFAGEAGGHGDTYNGVNVGNENTVVVPVQACGDGAAVLSLVVTSGQAGQCSITMTTADHGGTGKGHGKHARREEYNGINLLNNNTVAAPVQACGDRVVVAGAVVPVGSPKPSHCTQDVVTSDGGGSTYNGISAGNENSVVVPAQVCGDHVAVLGAVATTDSPMRTFCRQVVAAARY